ncbi:MarR family transcriptional regulator [Actinospongicola halichondriae]|uniref:MarR family transcriptional regulator n=1 Tax=Actinospongicola halichondriae TaxID=3236844 RepID=UPI003D430B04
MPLDFDPVAEARRNWEHHGWTSVEAMAAATSISRANQILVGRIDATLAPLGLTFSRFEALALLHFTSDGCLPMGKVGERLQVHAASVTNTVDRLERDGYVERRRHRDDGRTVLACITANGRSVVERAAASLGDVDFGLDGPDSVDHDAVTAVLTPVRRNAGDF